MTKRTVSGGTVALNNFCLRLIPPFVMYCFSCSTSIKRGKILFINFNNTHPAITNFLKRKKKKNHLKIVLHFAGSKV